MAKNKKWFVIMWEDEINMFKVGELFERAIYESIKSYCGNGKLEIDLSSRQIAARANVSYMSVQRYLPNLLKKGMVTITGKKPRVGGVVNIYKVALADTLTGTGRATKKEKTGTTREESGTGVGMEPISIKVKRNINTKENNLSSSITTGNLEKKSEVEFSPEKRKKIWDAVNSWSAEKLAQQRGGK